MARRSVIVFVFWALTSTAAWAGTTCTSASKAFDGAAAAYLKSGSQAFMDRFLRESPLSKQVSSADGVRKLNQIEQTMGPMLGWSIISRKSLGERSCYLIAALEYTDGPAFLAAMYYEQRKGAVPLSIRLEADPEKVLSAPGLIEP